MSDHATPLTLRHPPIVQAGAGTGSGLGAWAQARGAARVLVVADAFNADRVPLLGLEGSAVEVFGEVIPEPDTANLDSLLAVAGRFRPDMVVGFGGGSAMDLAKLAAVLGDGDQELADVVGPDRVAGRRPRLAQVPTTAGTGSEAGTRALVTEAATARKLAVESPHMLADIAVLDPGLTVSLPAAITAATGVDALAHCVESYTSRKAHPVVDPYAVEGIRLVGRYLPQAVADGSDAEARAALLRASFCGGVCLGPVNTAAGHAVAYPLGTRHHLPHGLANALIFPHVLAFNAPAVPERTAMVLGALGAEDVTAASPQAVAEAALGFCRGLGIDMRLAAHGVPESDFEEMAGEAHAIRRLMDNNPRDMTPADILAVYRAAT